MVTAGARAVGPACAVFSERGANSVQQRGDEVLLRMLAGDQKGFDANGELCVLKGRLYLASLRGSPIADPNKYYITLTQKMRYVPYCADFGPYNLGECARIRRRPMGCCCGWRLAGARASCQILRLPAGGRASTVR